MWSFHLGVLLGLWLLLRKQFCPKHNLVSHEVRNDSSGCSALLQFFPPCLAEVELQSPGSEDPATLDRAPASGLCLLFSSPGIRDNLWSEALGYNSILRYCLHFVLKSSVAITNGESLISRRSLTSWKILLFTPANASIQALWAR